MRTLLKEKIILFLIFVFCLTLVGVMFFQLYLFSQNTKYLNELQTTINNNEILIQQKEQELSLKSNKEYQDREARKQGFAMKNEKKFLAN